MFQIRVRPGILCSPHTLPAANAIVVVVATATILLRRSRPPPLWSAVGAAAAAPSPSPPHLNEPQNRETGSGRLAKTESTGDRCLFTWTSLEWSEPDQVEESTDGGSSGGSGCVVVSKFILWCSWVLVFWESLRRIGIGCIIKVEGTTWWWSFSITRFFDVICLSLASNWRSFYTEVTWIWFFCHKIDFPLEGYFFISGS